MFSRTATGLIAGAVAEVGTSDFAAVTDLDFGDFAVELGAAPERTLLPEPAARLLVLPAVPGAAFEPNVAPEAGFVAVLLAGLAVAFDVAAPAGELGTEPDAGLGSGVAGLIAEVVGGAGFGFCACFGVAAPEEAA
jgi:hypothetical protein